MAQVLDIKYAEKLFFAPFFLMKTLFLTLKFFLSQLTNVKQTRRASA